MDTSTLIMLAVAAALLLGIYLKTPALAGAGLGAGVGLFLDILPRMIAAFIIAGLIQAVVPEELIAPWMGAESGWRGLLIAMGLGAVTPGGPMMQFPIVASLYKSGVGIGPLISYLTAWSVLGVHRAIVWEIPFLGPRVVAIRLAASFAFPVFAGWLSALLWKEWGS
jgi:uncharacterized membrane protein YraQ (UPF0718 family)